MIESVEIDWKRLFWFCFIIFAIVFTIKSDWTMHPEDYEEKQEEYDGYDYYLEVIDEL